jgi:radical SAM superfamily enzyme YgiQ (UPF0313 family)
MAEIALINPRFEPSYWGLEHALPFFGKQAAMPVASLPLLAALTPPTHRVTIYDENLAPLPLDRIGRADIVGLTGMSVQRRRMREILEALNGSSAFRVVGGPWVSVDERSFGDGACTVFVGEAEETWPRFLDDFEQGRPAFRYEQAARTDMTSVPVPRYDLLDMSRYLFGSIQLSRGCPFQCEFCDIIVTFGRRPRLKTVGQVVAELDALLDQGLEIVFIVDDNLIGNKRGVTPLLEAVRDWQEARGFPFIFVTEASLDLAEDEPLMRLMLDANILSVFIGIESPNEASLLETRKHQNVKRGLTVAERVRTVQRVGLEVWSGMILGFDHDDETIFEAQRRFLEDARIAQAMVGMLTAIPKTPLHARLEATGRLDVLGEASFGTNVVPAGMTRETLRDGYVRMMQEIYEPDAYFARLAASLGDGSVPFAPARARYWRRHRWAGFKSQATAAARALGLLFRLIQRVDDVRLRRRYQQEAGRQLLARRDPGFVFGYLVRCAMHYHHFTLAHEMAARPNQVVNSF